MLRPSCLSKLVRLGHILCLLAPPSEPVGAHCTIAAWGMQPGQFPMGSQLRVGPSPLRSDQNHTRQNINCCCFQRPTTHAQPCPGTPNNQHRWTFSHPRWGACSRDPQLPPRHEPHPGTEPETETRKCHGGWGWGVREKERRVLREEERKKKNLLSRKGGEI